MAATDAMPFPTRGVAFRAPVVFRDQDGAVVSTWASLTVANVTNDGASVVSHGATAAEIGTTGHGYVDIPAATMDGSLIMVTLTVGNANATPCVLAIYPADLRDTPNNTRTVLRLDIMVAASFRRFHNRRREGDGNLFTVFRDEPNHDQTYIAGNILWEPTRVCTGEQVD